MNDNDAPRVFLGLDVGKCDHWACAFDEAGTILWVKTLPNDQAKLEELFNNLSTHGQILVVVDQPATIGALAVGLAQQMGIEVAYLPGLRMRRVADLHPGDAKTDQKDAFIIADAARSLSYTLRELTPQDEDDAALGMLTGFDLDLTRQVNQVSNRTRGLYTQIYPALEKALCAKLDHDAILEVLTTWPTPERLHRAGRARIDAKLNKHGTRRHQAWAQELLDALTQQSTVVTGTDAAQTVIPTWRSS